MSTPNEASRDSSLFPFLSGNPTQPERTTPAKTMRTCQRHQVYVIADTGPQYRVLAALDCHHLFGAQAVRQCLQLLQTFSEQDNINYVELDLLKARNTNWDDFVCAGDSHSETAVFTVIAGCLRLNFSPSRLETGEPRSSLIPITWHFDGQEILNDDWITIIDITELGKLRYAFMHPDHCVLVAARTYLEAYQTRLGNDLDAIEAFDVVGVAAVSSVWPGYNFKALDDSDEAKMLEESEKLVDETWVKLNQWGMEEAT